MRKESNPPANMPCVELPVVSVVIPARNAERALPRAIDSVLEQTYGGEIEVIVAEGGSTDGTRASVERFGDRVIIVDNPSGTTPDALNAAIASSTGSVIVRCDAHARLPPDYVATAVTILRETGAANVGGIQHATGTGLWERVVAAAQSTPLGVGDARYRLGGAAGPVDTVYLGVFRRAALDAVGGFDPHFLRNQDYELNWRLRERGETVWFDPRLRVDYTPRSTLGSLARQYFDYGRWKRRMVRRHPGSLRLRQVAAPTLVVGLVISVITAVFDRRLAAVLPGLYGVALGATAVTETAKRGDAAMLLMPSAISVMHIAWGVGFLVGQTDGDV